MRHRPGNGVSVMDPGTEVDVETRRTRFEEFAPGIVDPLRRFLARRTDPATAEDVLADTLLVCWRRVEQVPAEPLPWAYAVARHCLANAERSSRRQRRVAAKVAALDPPATSLPGPDDDGSDPGEGRDGALDAALAALRPGDAELLRLWAWEQLQPAQIAQVLEVTPNAAAIRLHRARQRLGAELRTAHAREAELRKNGPGAGHEESRGGRIR